MAEIARNENRCLLSKAPYFLKCPNVIFYQIKSADTEQQLKEVIEHFHLSELFRPFTRCLYCNEILDKKEKEEVTDSILPETKRYFFEFWKCPSCNKIYWKGSHYERMKKLIEELKIIS